MNHLLDSHTVLWTLYEPGILPQAVARLIESPETNVFISEGSVWELSDKAAKNRLPLAGNSVPQLIKDMDALGATILPIERADIPAPLILPPHHGDPFDRLFIAQAQLRNLVLVSKDPDIAKYESIQVLWG